jgi:sugar lactone lactonase YvrE
LDRIDTADPCIACMLGGADRRTLYIVTGEVEPAELALARRGSAIWQARVEVPGAGRP